MQSDDDLARAIFARMRWNIPLSVEHANLLLERLAGSARSHVLDLGCGWGELLIRAIVHCDTIDRGLATGTGVDIDPRALGRARTRADEYELGDRVHFVACEAADWVEPADSVICVGASHAWDGTQRALSALTNLVRPGGRLLFGDTCWENAPSAAATAMFGEETLTLKDLVAHAVSAGWRVLHLSTADQREWDDFEATWRAGRQEWLLDNGSDPRAGEVRDKLDSQLRAYVADYRGVLGFCYLILGRS